MKTKTRIGTELQHPITNQRFTAIAAVPIKRLIARAIMAVLVVSAGASPSVAQDKPSDSPTVYDQSPERGPHHRVWSVIEKVKTPEGAEILQTNRFTQVESGLHYWNVDHWADSEEVIDLVEGVGAVAQRGPESMVWDANLNSETAVDCLAPDGARLRANILGLRYWEPESGKTAWVAQVQDCVGELLPPNQILYRKATDKVDCTVKYVYKKGGFEQEVVLIESPPPPGAFGLSENSQLQVVTEWLNPPIPQIIRTIIKTGQGQSDPNGPINPAQADLVDEQISFGAVQIGPGKAFATEDSTADGVSTGGVPVFKQWLNEDQRYFLIESVEYQAIKERLAKLPAAAQILRSGPRAANLAAVGQAMPSRRVARSAAKAVIQVAALSRFDRGLTIDYRTLLGPTNFQFAGIYKVTGNLNLSGATVVSPGAVVRVVPGASILVTSGSFASPGATAYFVSNDDPTGIGAGATTTGGTGAPCAPSVGTCLTLNVPSPVVQNLEFRNLSTALQFLEAGEGCALENCTFRECDTAIESELSSGQWRNLSTCNVGTLYRNADGGGAFTGGTPLSACDDYGNAPGWAQAIGLNSTTEGKIDYPGDVDYFRIDLPGPGTLGASTSGTADTVGYLVSPSCGILVWADDANPPDNLNFSFSSFVANGGPYYVCVRHYSPIGIGSYTLNVTWASAAPPVITSQPLSVSVSSGQQAAFSVEATGQGALSYQWRFNGVPIGGANAATYTIGNVQRAKAGRYDVVVSNSSGSTLSSTAVLSVGQTAMLVNGSFESDFDGWTTAGNVSIGAGVPYAATDGTKVAAFNWGNTAPNGVIAQTFATIIGQTYVLAFDVGMLARDFDERKLEVVVEGNGVALSQVISLTGDGSGAAGWVPKRCAVSANSGMATLAFRDLSPAASSPGLILDHVRLGSLEEPFVSSQPVSAAVLEGTGASFTVVASGQAILSYQWRFNGVPIAGANDSSYSIAAVQVAQAGDYDVVVSNAAGTVTSSTAVLTVTQPGTIGNGSFESGLACWTVIGNVKIGPHATDGVKGVIFNGDGTEPNGVLSQSFPTIPGQTYVLRFDPGVWATNNSEQRLQVTVQGNAALLSTTVSLTAASEGAAAWSPQSDTFAADGQSATLTFADVSKTSDGIDLLLDNVRVSLRDMTGAPRTLTLTSANPNSGVSLALPVDLLGAGNGRTGFARRYQDGALVPLEAPIEVNGNAFQKWLKDGLDWTSSRAVSVLMDGDHIVTAVFASPPDGFYYLSVTTQTPATGVPIVAKPPDANGSGAGLSGFTRLYSAGANVSFTAPSGAGGNVFLKWQVDGDDHGADPTISLTVDGYHRLTAVFGSPLVRTLAVDSTIPSAKAGIVVNGAGLSSAGGPGNPLTRSCAAGTRVSLTAPIMADGKWFVKWQMDGAEYSASPSVSVVMDANHTLTAVYGVDPGLKVSITQPRANSHLQ